MESWFSAWCAILEHHDIPTARHCERVELLAVAFATVLDFSNDDRTIVGVAARLHDVGKIYVPDSVLQKSGPLDLAEWEVMKCHSVYGERVIRAVSKLPFQNEIALAVRHHHENYDGMGYPDRLHGEAIPMLSRLLSVVDGYDAMRRRRTYHAPRSHKEVMAILESERGIKYDPHLLEAFLSCDEQWFARLGMSESL